MKKFILSFVLITFGFLLFTVKFTCAQNANPANTDTQRIDKLETRLDDADKYNDKILTTVYWSLSGLATVVVLVVGLGWYTNFRVYNRDIQQLKNELIVSLRADLKAELIIFADEQVNKKVDIKLHDLDDIKFDLLETEVKRWKTRQVYGNMFMLAVDLLKLSLQIKNDFKIVESLKYLTDSIQSDALENNNTSYIDLLDTLETVPTKFNNEIDIIKSLLKDTLKKTKQI